MLQRGVISIIAIGMFPKKFDNSRRNIILNNSERYIWLKMFGWISYLSCNYLLI